MLNNFVLEHIALVQNVSAMARASVGSGADAIHAGLLTRGVTFVSGEAHFVARFAGAFFWCGTDSVEATTAK